MEYELITNPTNELKNEVYTWIESEREKSTVGFYHKIDKIKEFFENGKALLLNKNNNPIGFICYLIDDKNFLLEIEFFAIHPDYRNSDDKNGTKLFEFFEDFMRKKGIKVFHLYSLDIESHVFWKKMNFKEYYFKESNERFKILNKPNSNKYDECQTDDYIKIWFNISSKLAECNKSDLSFVIDDELDEIFPLESKEFITEIKLGNKFIKDRIKYISCFDEISMLNNFIYLTKNNLTLK